MRPPDTHTLEQHVADLTGRGVLNHGQVRARVAKDGVRVLCGYSSCGHGLGSLVTLEALLGASTLSEPARAVQLEPGMAPSRSRMGLWQRSGYAANRARRSRTLKNRSYPTTQGELAGNDVMDRLFEPLPQVVVCPKCRFSNQLWASDLGVDWIYVVPANPCRDRSRSQL